VQLLLLRRRVDDLTTWTLDWNSCIIAPAFAAANFCRHFACEAAGCCCSRWPVLLLPLLNRWLLRTDHWIRVGLCHE